MWGLYVDYSRSVVERMCTMWEVYLFRGTCQYCECMYGGACAQVVYCIEFIQGVYTDIVV